MEKIKQLGTKILNIDTWCGINEHLYFNTLSDAMKVLDGLKRIAGEYCVASVADLLVLADLTGITEVPEWKLNEYVWDRPELEDASIEPASRYNISKGNYRLILPWPESRPSNWQNTADPCKDGYLDDLCPEHGSSWGWGYEAGWKRGFEFGKKFAMKQVQSLLDSLKGADEK